MKYDYIHISFPPHKSPQYLSTPSVPNYISSSFFKKKKNQPLYSYVHGCGASLDSGHTLKKNEPHFTSSYQLPVTFP